MLSVIILSVPMQKSVSPTVSECQNYEFHSAECIMQSLTLLIVVMLSVKILTVILLSFIIMMFAMLSVIMLCSVSQCWVECHNAFIMLSAIILSNIMYAE